MNKRILLTISRKSIKCPPIEISFLGNILSIFAQVGRTVTLNKTNNNNKQQQINNIPLLPNIRVSHGCFNK